MHDHTHTHVHTQQAQPHTRAGAHTHTHMCQPSRNRAGNPAFWLFFRIPAFLPDRPAFLALFRNKTNR